MAGEGLEARLRRLAGSAATVLLVGESGTGKSRAARRLHELSGRPGALVLVHLGALSPSLIESELFGHEAGAFTGAQRARQGAFRRAHGGTLVLDDVELLPRESQVKLLRVLQERVVEPLGAERSEPIDARFVATTSARLADEVAAGRLRNDLYWRLNVVAIEVPPLRARRAELQDLAQGLLQAVAERAQVPPRGLSAGALQRLSAHPWPGNVRELENALERALALSRGEGPLEAADFEFLSEGLLGAADRLALQALAQGIDLERFEAALLRAAWAQERGNLSAAARAAGLSRRAFEYRLQRLLAPADGPPAGQAGAEPEGAP
jgi:DNA-binding NtrC family response regulator